MLARILAAEIRSATGWTIVIENLTGGGGTVGTAAAARAASDGYTWFFGSGGTNGIHAAGSCLHHREYLRRPSRLPGE
ncbi:tripartite tricarboxylate transporter substrate-binding protein [Roseomonas xinghualingensis]|uniref:tripartite tricarboxylate transporter substrate-binding protein n=1 Tax=Roseomonas xinghualingensis TaxID=2986475 RepID=UPI00366E23F0